MSKQSFSQKEQRKYSPEWLRQFKGYEHYTDEQANEELNSLDQLAGILLQVTNRNGKWIYHSN